MPDIIPADYIPLPDALRRFEIESATSPRLVRLWVIQALQYGELRLYYWSEAQNGVASLSAIPWRSDMWERHGEDIGVVEEAAPNMLFDSETGRIGGHYGHWHPECIGHIALLREDAFLSWLPNAVAAVPPHPRMVTVLRQERTVEVPTVDRFVVVPKPVPALPNGREEGSFKRSHKQRAVFEILKQKGWDQNLPPIGRGALLDAVNEMLRSKDKVSEDTLLRTLKAIGLA